MSLPALLYVVCERHCKARNIYLWSVTAAKLLDFTAATYISGPCKLATFAIVIHQLMSRSDFTFLRS